ncbi:hypothetical protein [aff. Roholtiella sp. LEGE 12411]|uniref:hypothetical protein n=1 Tax=aff. Roholtiella sp. LEGE 12411 TaxID=1828822 RepID=UPI0018824846|nr:hypothetical protein [aff. Roholtiella sp. LEGE 12411]MBE9035142.1 hypothetical protein [aff. Roholtiella sp. LEGE 12411]
MSKKSENENQNNPDGGLLGDIKQKAEEMISQAGSFFGQSKDEEEKKDKFKNKKDDDDDDDD